jgi:nucleoside-diphosphate-sugar epimerase
MGLHVIVGRGPVGTATAARLLELGEAVRVISRSAGPVPAGAEHVALDASGSDALAAAARGAVAVYNCANPAYHRWATDWPPLSSSLLHAAEVTGAVLVTMGNLYGYGPTDAPMTEDTPLAARTVKGRVRNAMWHEALARHAAGRVRVTEARASDFFGPGVADQGHIARVTPRLLAGKRVQVLGDPDAPHSWTYVPDVARTLVRLATDERAWGRAWHVPTVPPRSQRQMAEAVAAAAGSPPARVGRVPWSMVRMAGLVQPGTRAILELRYQFDRPFVLDSSRYAATFGDSPTAYDEQLAQTAAWWLERRSGDLEVHDDRSVVRG